MLISLVIPTLNEADAIATLLPALQKIALTLKERGFNLEVIIVDDGSTDGTAEKIKSIQQSFNYQIVLMQRTVRDLSTAVIDGWKRAQGEIWGVMDADLSHPPAVIPELIEALTNADIAVGSRNIPGGGVENWPYIRRLYSRMGASLAKLVGIKVADPMSGFFFFNKKVLDGVTLSPIGYKILLEILVKGHYDKVQEVAYIFLNRTVGKSKLGRKVMINYLRHLWRLLLWKIHP